jgi:hypothetical protein
MRLLEMRISVEIVMHSGADSGLSAELAIYVVGMAVLAAVLVLLYGLLLRR